MPRPAGSKNKMGATAKENVITVFKRIGGLKKMAQWATENPSEFYKLYAKLIPQQIDMEVNIKPTDVTSEPLPAKDWDEQYGSGPQLNG